MINLVFDKFKEIWVQLKVGKMAYKIIWEEKGFLAKFSVTVYDKEVMDINKGVCMGIFKVVNYLITLK